MLFIHKAETEDLAGAVCAGRVPSDEETKTCTQM
jgi:hypothetical protein